MLVIRVQCHSGYRAEQRPLSFQLGDRLYQVDCVEDQWYSPAAMYFRVLAEDGNRYLLRHDEECGIWTLEAFRRHDTIPGQLRK